jgi:hypothetical protein
LNEEVPVTVRLTIRPSKLKQLIEALENLPDGANISRAIREQVAKDPDDDEPSRVAHTEPVPPPERPTEPDAT